MLLFCFAMERREEGGVIAFFLKPHFFFNTSETPSLIFILGFKIQIKY